MKRVIFSILISLLMLAPSCVRRTVIPDNELAMIFRDAFLTNAYVYDLKVEFDTLQVYQPIFDKYGYTAEDVAYTVGSFSKRKSARLSDIVEQSIALLEKGEGYYRFENTIIDTIETKARREARRLIYADSLIEYHSMSDSTKLTINFDSLAAGRYEINFEYLVDSLDNNRSSYRTMTWVATPGTKIKKGLSTSYLRKHVEGSYRKTLNYDTLTHNVVLQLAESYEVKRKPHITFKDLEVYYTPATDKAVEEMFKRKLDIRIFANDFFKLQQTDSLELPSL